MQSNDEQPGDREAAGAIAGMLEVYGPPAVEPVTEQEHIERMVDIQQEGMRKTIHALHGPAESRFETTGAIYKVDRLLLENVVLPILRAEKSRTCEGVIRRMLDRPFETRAPEPVTEGIPLDLLVVDPTELE
jgi:hypothetical protein